MLMTSLYQLVDHSKITDAVKANPQGSLKTAPFYSSVYIYCAYHTGMKPDDFILQFMNICENRISNVYPDNLRPELTKEVIAESQYMWDNGKPLNALTVMLKIKNNCCFKER